VKVTDFGLVKRLDQMDFSRTGELLGTPSYMAPEQAAGRKDVGPAVDVYALGAILYEGLSGRPPFQGENALSLLSQVASAEPIPPSRLRRGVSRDLEAVVLKCLEKNPARRYASAAALAEDLRRFLAGEPTQARPLTVVGRAVKLVRRHPLPAALLTLIALSLAGGLTGIVWQWREAVQARGNLQTALGSEAEQRRQAEQNLYQSHIAQASLLWENGQAAQARDLLASCRPRAGEEDPRAWEWYYLNRLFHAEVRTERLPGPVTGLALCPSRQSSPDELAVALGQSRLNRDKPASETESGFLQPTAAPGFRPGSTLSGAVTSIAVQSSGPLAAWGIGDHKLVVGDRTTGQILWTVTLREGVKGLCFTPEGNLLAGGAFNRVREWNPQTGEELAQHSAAIGITDALAIQPTGSLVAAGNKPSSRLSVYERPTYRLVKELPSQGTGLLTVAFSADGSRLAAGYQSGNVSVWETSSWREVWRFQGTLGPVHALAFHPSGRLLATGGADRMVRLWNLTTGQTTAVYRGHDDVLTLAFGPRGDWLASGSRDHTVRLWDPTHDPRGQLLSHHPGPKTIAFDRPPANLTVRTLNREGKRQVWVLAGDRPLLQSELSPRDLSASFPRPSAMLTGGRVAIISVTDRRKLAIWDSEPGEASPPGKPIVSQPRRVLPAGTGPVQAVAADSTGRWLFWAAGAGPDGVAIRRWDSASEVEAEPIRLNVPAVQALAAEPAAGWLVAVTSQGKQDRSTVVWAIDLTGRQSPCEVLRDPRPLGGVAFRPDGRELAITLGDTVSVFGVGSWELTREFSCLAPATGLTFSPDGRRLAAVSDAGVVTLLDPATGKSLFQLHSLGQPGVQVVGKASVAFSASGAWLVSTNRDGTFNLWDGSPLQDP